MDKIFGCKPGVGRCIYCEDDGECTLICGTGRPKGEALCDVEDVSEPIEFDEEEFIKFLTGFADDIKK